MTMRRRPGMANRRSKFGPRRAAESGHLLIAVMVGVGVLLVFSTVALQAWSTTIKRDREEELIFRGRQIAMAIRLFQKFNGRFPGEYKELQQLTGQGGGQYVLRHPYKDPMMPSGEWGYVYLTPQGQTITSATIAENQKTGGGAGAIGEETVGQPVTSVAGLPFVGVHSMSEEAPIGPARWHGSMKYSEWLFTINDLGQASPLGPPGAGLGGAPTGIGAPVGAPGGGGIGGTKPGGGASPGGAPKISPGGQPGLGPSGGSSGQQGSPGGIN